MKHRILDWIWNRYYPYYKKYIILPPIDLEKLYEENKETFQLLMVKDFTGYIPKDIQEPALKMFKEYGEQFEKWTLWQSWYINRKAINDPLKIPFYNGMMVYLKALNTIARTNKQNYQPPKIQDKEDKVVTSWIDESLEDIKYFKSNANKVKSPEDDKTAEDGKATEV